MNFIKQMNKAVSLQTECAPYVKRMLTPALSALGLDYFWFVRLIAGQFHLSVGIVPPSIELYQKRQTEDLYFKDDKILWQKQTTIFWGTNNQGDLTQDMLNKLSLQRGICVFRRKKDYVDVFYIASSKDVSGSIYDLYLNRPEMIFRLIGFFEEMVLPKLPISDRDFLLPYMDGRRLKMPAKTQRNLVENITNFYAATRLKKFSLHKGSEKFNVSLRELQCLYYLARGYTSKDIANALGISFRTVEHYLLNTRNKTECIGKTELIELYRQNDVATWFSGS